MIYEQLNLEDTYWVCVTVARFLGEPESRKTDKDLENVWRRLAIYPSRSRCYHRSPEKGGGIREPVVIMRAHHLCARMREGYWSFGTNGMPVAGEMYQIMYFLKASRYVWTGGECVVGGWHTHTSFPRLHHHGYTGPPKSKKLCY